MKSSDILRKMAEPELFQPAQNLEIILASASPRRRELLGALGLPFSIAPGNIPEPGPEQDEEPGPYACRVATAKALSCAKTEQSSSLAKKRLIIAADTTVAIGGVILGKPADSAQALRMLQMLSGRCHTVCTGVCMLVPENSGACGTYSFFESSKVVFHHWAPDVLAAYARLDEPLDKAGAYAIQGSGSFLAERIDGSVSNVIGLPMTRLVAELLRLGLIFPAQ